MRIWLVLLILPPAGPLLLLLLGLLWKRVRAWLPWLALVLAWLLACEGVTGPLARSWAPSEPLGTTLLKAEAWKGREDAVVLVLGGGVRGGLGPTGGYEPKIETLERLHRGVWWARRLNLKLAFSGGLGTVPEPGQPTEAEVVQHTLHDHYALNPAWLEAAAKDTRENASFSVPLLRQHGQRKVLLVTHALHMPRALAHFRAAAPELEFLPLPLTRVPDARPSGLDFVPSPEGLRLGRYWTYEVMAKAVGH